MVGDDYKYTTDPFPDETQQQRRRSLDDSAESYANAIFLDVSRAYVADIAPDAVSLAPAGRSVLDYVKLPAEEYNVLDSKAVTRVEPEIFRVSAGAQKILWLEVEPIGMLRVTPSDRGCDQFLEGAVMKVGRG